jgi:uncharacterized protein YjlB
MWIAVVKGSSELLIGVGPLDSEAEGEVIHVESGDVIVLPAGVSHCSKSFSEDYRYIGAYPKVCNAVLLFNLMPNSAKRALSNGRTSTVEIKAGLNHWPWSPALLMFRTGTL